MPRRSLTDQLDQAVEAFLARPGAQPPRVDPSIAALVDIARDLRDLPRQSFKARLKSDLERRSFMTGQATTVPAARQTATPHLRIKNAAAAIEFYKKAFGAREVMRFEVHGKIAYAEIAIGNSGISLGEEALEYGYPGPQTLGGSPISLHLLVEDVDALVEHAVAAGAKLIGAVQDQFYGDRSGTVQDPFGYSWGIATRKKEMSVDEMHQRFEEMEKEQMAGRTAPSFIPEGYHSITPYMVVQDAPALIDFVTQVFDAKETFRAIGSAGGIHAEVRVGDSRLMMGGGAPDLSWRGQSWPSALHIYVKDTDAVYERALKAGAQSIQPPADQEYGERSGSVKDQFGNHWYIATAKGENYIAEGLRSVNPYLHPLRAEPLISFLKRGFGAEELAKYASPDGVIHHARIKIGDSVLEMGEAHGPYQPMPTMFYLYVPNVDATYNRALTAGAISTGEPADQHYGDRTASVKDAFGNQWYIATHIRDAQP
jgi:PhnB protein